MDHGDGTSAPGTTGRYLVLMRHGELDAGVKALRESAGVEVARSSDFAGSTFQGDPLAAGSEQAIVFDDLAVALVDTPPDRVAALQASAEEEGAILAVEAERMVYALDEQDLLPAPASQIAAQVVRAPSLQVPLESNRPIEPSNGYLRGYRDAVDHLVERLLAQNGVAVEGAVLEMQARRRIDESQATWGLQATRVTASTFSGRGIRVAVLDTGMDVNHPDFAQRNITTRSFVNGQSAQDGHGHGTHCIGTSCGPQVPGVRPRYGIAFEAGIFAGKVLSNQGSGGDGGILAGIQWAIDNGCAVVSMSLGAAVAAGQPFSPIFETMARRALNAGTLIIAAAGNESMRANGVINPVGHPANCPSIMAVAALDSRLQVADFSNGGFDPQGGQVDIAGPGVDVRSSWPRPILYRTISGTSMATPHVAGIAALFAEATPGARGLALWSLLTQAARRVSLPARDVGARLVQAP